MAKDGANINLMGSPTQATRKAKGVTVPMGKEAGQKARFHGKLGI